MLERPVVPRGAERLFLEESHSLRSCRGCGFFRIDPVEVIHASHVEWSGTRRSRYETTWPMLCSAT
jgi:hypothetical protein